MSQVVNSLTYGSVIVSAGLSVSLTSNAISLRGNTGVSISGSSISLSSPGASNGVIVCGSDIHPILGVPFLLFVLRVVRTSYRAFDILFMVSQMKKRRASMSSSSGRKRKQHKKKKLIDELGETRPSAQEELREGL